jgi:16S rRNA U516 pseudouridylate synthase RsuA-like enzyme
MCEAIGHPVDHLHRVAIGPIKDAKLKLGAWRDLTEDEVARLRRAVIGDKGTKRNKGYKGHKG